MDEPSYRMEVLCADNLISLHLYFGIPFLKNDTSIMAHLPFFQDVIKDVWPKVRPSVCVSGNQLRKLYLLADVMYPSYVFFSLPLPEPRTRKDLLYSVRHNSSRKAVERLFGVRFRQFRILYIPSSVLGLSIMETVMKASCNLHNMIAYFLGYDGTMTFTKTLDE